MRFLDYPGRSSLGTDLVPGCCACFLCRTCVLNRHRRHGGSQASTRKTAQSTSSMVRLLRWRF